MQTNESLKKSFRPIFSQPTSHQLICEKCPSMLLRVKKTHRQQGL